jgi:type VII secretion-associated serine protease mycosin
VTRGTVTMRVHRAVTAGALALLAAATGALVAPGVAQAETIRDREWYLNTLNIPQVQKITKGSGVKVAVIDSGVYGNHPDLRGQVLPGTGFGPDATSDGSDNGGHGTLMASVIAGKGGSSSHVLGIAPQVKILPISTGTGSSPEEISQGIHYAVDHGARVINISEGRTEAATQTSIDAVRYALSKNVVVVASAGNKPETSVVAEPANVPGVVAVSATDKSNQLWSGSATGPEVVLAAPGVGIVGADIPSRAPSGYALGDGSSGAGAIVSAVAALIIAKYPQITAANVINRLIRTAQDQGAPGRDEDYGYGVVNPLAAVTASVPDVSQNPLLSPAGGAGPTAAPRTGATKKDQGFPIGIGVTNKTGAIIQVVLCLAVVVGLIILIVYLRKRSKRSAANRAPVPPPGWGAPGAQPGWPPQTPPGQSPGAPPWSAPPPSGAPGWAGQQPAAPPGPPQYGAGYPPPPGPPTGGNR